MMRSVMRRGVETKMTHNRSDEIKRILERKNGAYAEFLSATLLLEKALEAEGMEEVNRLIERRTGLIGEIDGLDREIVRCQKEGPHDQPDETVWSKMAVSEDLGDKLRRILSANRDCHAIAAGRLSALREELLSLHETEEGLRGYIRHAEQIPKFLNVRT
jgi:hypothetical protein